jgi:hypothetical protein
LERLQALGLGKLRGELVEKPLKAPDFAVGAGPVFSQAFEV